MLTAQWTHRLPFIQQQSPAELAASLIIRTLDKYEDLEDTKFSVIDFCSGGGGTCTPTLSPPAPSSCGACRVLTHPTHQAPSP